ncbi:oocyte zinc finger protein XlCOF8.4 [Synchiropus splendidus]|uniref:oocyte zinc finger protein XlCOF8.4 n=1 Tax=Synchiropus splendidus TaxID=270530 RepID=UPI00237D6BAB|nr:oocyte zinc finger protein XlCOF8.4 [Synchiropus splendidus]
MAAVAPSETLERQESAADEAVTSGEGDDGVRSPCGRDQAAEAAGKERADSASPDGERGAETGDNGGDLSSPSGVESGAGALKTTWNSPEDLTSAQKMAEPPEASEERDFDWSEPEDGAVQTNEGENDKCDAKQQEPVLEAAAGGEETPAEKEEEDSVAKPKKCSIFCKECGKYFNQRETYNLHRHFHTCENELTVLTCKECGLTFQQRSSFVKHRNEHKEKEAKAEESVFQCAGCDRFFSNLNKLRSHTCDSASEKPYHCPLCHQQFQFKVSVNKHMMIHSQEGVFKCAECNHTFPDPLSLRVHQRCHGALKPYECPDCGMVFKHYSLMEYHRRRHVDNTRSHLCNICGKSFKYSSLLHQHQYLHTGQKPFRCPECGKKFAFAQNMKAHCRQHRLQRNNPSLSVELPPKPAPLPEAVRGKENAVQREEVKRTFNCPLCPQTYSAPAELRTHMRLHEAEYESMERRQNIPKDPETYWEKGHTCTYCPSTFRDEISLKAHIKSAHKQAPYSDSTTAAAPAVHKQLTLLSPENVQPKWKSDGIVAKSFKCPECEKSFRHRSVLELHMRIHSKDKPYQCKVCGKAFRFGSYLQQHLIIHTGKKPYKCPDCGKDFAFLQNMKTHQKLHQEKPFRCTSCRKGYSDETQLQQHMLSHNGDKPHKCDLCDKSFGLAYLLRDHMNTHTGDRPHRCDECHKSFSWFSSLLVHQKIHARKRQSSGLFAPFPEGSRVRGRGVRGRRGGRHMWGLTRPLGELGLISSPPAQYSVPTMRDIEMHRRAAQQPQPSLVPSQPDLQVRSHKDSSARWKVEGGEQPHVSTQPIIFDGAAQSGLQLQIRIPQHSFSSSHASEKPTVNKSPPSVVNSHPSGLPIKSSPSVLGELEQQRLGRSVTWTSAIASAASVSSLPHEFTVPSSFIDGAALWSVRPSPLPNSQSSPNKPAQELLPMWPGSQASKKKELSTPSKKEENRLWDVTHPPASTVSQAEKPWNGCDPQKPWASGLVSTTTQIDQSSPLPISTSVSHRVGSPLWDLQTAPGISKSITSPEKLINSKEFQLQQKQVSAGWSQPATQKVSISIPFEPHRFAQGMGTPVWSFQNNPVSPQSLLGGSLKPGSGQEQQPPPMVTAAQILINQPPPFFSPALAPLASLAMPHSLHSVALPRAPHPNIFFSPQAVITDRSHLAQPLSLPQLPPRNEPHKLGARLPFPPERLLQCMICGCSLPRELDLQMHYLQHAQGEI